MVIPFEAIDPDDPASTLVANVEEVEFAQTKELYNISLIMLTFNYITTRVKARLSVYHITCHSAFLPSTLILSIKGDLKVHSNENLPIAV